MNKKVTIVYDDTRQPNRDIKNITGKKGFGDTIFKRVTLKERMRYFFENMDCVETFYDNKEIAQVIPNIKTPVFLIYSNFVVNDADALEILVNKAIYAHENYCVKCDNKEAAVIFCDAENMTKAGRSDFSAYPVIDTNCLTDISDIFNFRQFITSGFEARFFNSLSGDKYTVIKSSENIEKLKAEYTYYSLLPDSMKQWFVMPYDFKQEDGKASYCMQRYHMTDLAIRYIHGAVSTEEFTKILDNLFYFVKNRSVIEVSQEEYEAGAKSLYVDKVKTRIDQLKELPEYEELAKQIVASTDYSSVDEIFERYCALYDRIRGGRKFINIQVIGHGDLCFSNILYSNEASLLKLIDPKGATDSKDLYMDPFYDLAKLSHSICGHYDFFNSDLVEITLDEKLKAHVIVEADNRDYVELFKNKLKEHNIDFRLVRLYETSLFLSMLPLHVDRPKKVFGFILNALAIMDSLENEVENG